MAHEGNYRRGRRELSKEDAFMLRALLIAGLSVYVAVTALVPLFVPEVDGAEEERWIGADVGGLLRHYGDPDGVAEDGRGGNVITYEDVEVLDGAYNVVRTLFFVSSNRQVYAFKRVP